MTADERIEQILSWCRADIEAILFEPDITPEHWKRHFSRWGDYDAWRHRRAQAEQGIVVLSLSRWLGRTATHSETTLYSRAYHRGAELGYWTRLTSSGRTWGLEIIKKP